MVGGVRSVLPIECSFVGSRDKRQNKNELLSSHCPSENERMQAKEVACCDETSKTTSATTNGEDVESRGVVQRAAEPAVRITLLGAGFCAAIPGFDTTGRQCGVGSG
jgi:hypothetical protein